ncbi:type 4a pilus biogenesis protein PilO [Desulforamulus aquiferis]|uniref:Type 4a pilus biogenesis protein PilO n=1 Tax=Desulforamulus aquiferis TaxID=1397668 RepID=A0AAW7ZG08_9FIRM|nr:type 4a pilus biogenesis protein PilO [Desulforamulus aquiferis]MDO7788648.1 type 4a pilus biogenesis protein PilO [Desulforamulus aquiferis]
MTAKLTKAELPLIIGIVALLLILLLIYKQVGLLNQARQELQTEQAAVTQATSQLQSLVKIRDQSEHFQQELKMLEEIMPKEPRENLLIKLLESKAAKSGMQIKQIKFGQYESKQEHYEIPIFLTLEGQYHGLLNLLDELQAGPRALRTEEVKIGKGGNLSSIQVELTAKAFYLK